MELFNLGDTTLSTRKNFKILNTYTHTYIWDIRNGYTVIARKPEGKILLG
jgi:hypothetical protein